jgi:hypothetical protein
MERLVVQKKVMREISKQRRKQERSGGGNQPGERFVGLRKQKEWGLSEIVSIKREICQ